MQANPHTLTTTDTTNTNASMPTGILADAESSYRVYKTLHDNGYSKEDIDLMMSAEIRKQHLSANGKEKMLEIKTSQTVETTAITENEPASGTKALKAVGLGVVLGAAVGGAAAFAFVLVSSLLRPESGILSAGPMVTGLAAAGGIVGAIIGAMMGFGMPEDNAVLKELGRSKRMLLGLPPRRNKRSKESAIFLKKS
jgi:hypothetical protein